ncbi:reverse transcriptase [Cucumis melo var. makuwa]|uniref:Reverse transcriptase n=1 Tax=Cucumis melo var. makuwa TaxID=1194695 RepID=A0A5D3DWW5_CUCMM|nr:reverse transcriptase [Cucumis melo var. makuwa]
MANQVPVGEAIYVTKYFKATNTVIEEAKMTLAMMHLCEDAKLLWSSWYIDIQEGRCIIDTWDVLKKELRSCNPQLYNRGRSLASKTPLREGFQKNESRELCFPTYRRTSETNDDKVGRMESQMSSDYWIVSTVVQAYIRHPNGFKMISTMQLNKSSAQEEAPSAAILLRALGKLRETVPKDTLCIPEKCHGVMLNSWPKSLSMRRMIDHGIELLPEAKAPVKNAYRMAPPELVEHQKPSTKLLSTGFSRPVQAPYRASILSLKKKDKNPQRCIKRSILNKLTASHKYPFPILLNLFDSSCGVKYFPKPNVRPRHCRVRATKAEGLETTFVNGLRAYEFPVVPFSLTDAKGGKCCSVQRQINVLGHVVEFHQIEVGKRKIVATCDERIPKSVVKLHSCLRLANSNEQFKEGFLKRESSLIELLKEEDIKWGRNLEGQAPFDGPKQATTEGPSFGIADVTKRPNVEVEQFNYMLGEYVHHFEKEWEPMVGIARVCLEEASRPMKERVDQK